MFNKVREGLLSAIHKFIEKNVIDEKAIKEFMHDIQRELLQADVNFKIVYQLTKNVESKLFEERTKPGISLKESAILILYNEMVKIMGEGEKLNPSKGSKYVVLLVGIQGSGKTTFAAKLAKYFTKRGFKVGLVCADVYRPGAFEQLKTLAEKIPADVYGDHGSSSLEIAEKGKDYFASKGYDIIIIDTAGRHKEEKSLLEEMKQLESAIAPNLELLVIDGTIGQQAYAQAEAFAKSTNIGGIVVTKLDGTAKGGGALTAAAATRSKILFVSSGERIDDIEEFSPSRFAGRILGMGDLQALIEKARSLEAEIDVATTRRITSGKMTLNDFAIQLEQMGKLGPLQRILDMLPGLPKLEDSALDQMEANLNKWKVIMKSMTPKERQDPSIINASRIKRIAQGSGTTEKDVRELLNRFDQMKKMMKGMKKMRLNREWMKQFQQRF